MCFYRARRLHLVIGSVGFTNPDSSHDDTISWWLPFTAPPSPVEVYWDAGRQLLNAHAWLESDDGKVYDKITETVVIGAIRRKRPLKYDVDQVLEAVSHTEMRSHGLTYIAAAIDVQIAVFDQWWRTTKGGIPFHRSQIRVGQ